MPLFNSVPPQYQQTSTGGVNILSQVADGATAVGTIIDTNVAFSTVGAKLLSVQNHGTEKLTVGYSGTTTLTSGLPPAYGDEAITNAADRTFGSTPNWTGTSWSWSGSSWNHTVADTNVTTLAVGQMSTIVAGQYYKVVVLGTTTSTYTYCKITLNGGAVGYINLATGAPAVVQAGATTAGLIIDPQYSTQAQYWWTGSITSITLVPITYYPGLASTTELITNQVDRDFSGTPNWTGTNWAVESGTWAHSVAGANSTTLASQFLTSPITIGKSYKLIITVTTTQALNNNETAAYALKFVIGGYQNNANAGKVGTKTNSYVFVPATGGLNPFSADIVFTPHPYWLGSIDNLSLVEIPIRDPAIRVIDNSSVTYSAPGTFNDINVDPYGVSIGYRALCSRQQDGAPFNVAIGNYSLGNNLTGSGNISIGSNSLSNLTTGSNNISLGSNGNYMIAGSYNVAIGAGILNYNTEGMFNVGIGYYALQIGNYGNNNVALGNFAACWCSSDNNVAIGQQALYQIGRYDYPERLTSTNIAIGYRALRMLSGGTGNIAIGYDAAYPNAVLNNTITLGNSVSPTADNQIILGNSSVTEARTSGAMNALTHGPLTATSAILRGAYADGSGAVGTVLDNTITFATTGAKITSFRNNTVEKAYIDLNGNAYFAGAIGAGTSTLTEQLNVAGSVLFSGYAAAPATAPTVANGGAGTQKYATALNPLKYSVAYTTAHGTTEPGPISSSEISTDNVQVSITNIPTGPAGTTARVIYRNQYGYVKAVVTIADNTTTSYTDDMSYTAWFAVADANTSNTTAGQFKVGSNTAIAIDQSGNVGLGTSIAGGSPRASARINAINTFTVGNVAGMSSNSPALFRTTSTIAPSADASATYYSGHYNTITVDPNNTQPIGGVYGFNHATTLQGSGVVGAADNNVSIANRAPAGNLKALWASGDNNADISGFFYGFQSHVHNWAQDFASQYGGTEPRTHGSIGNVTACRLRVQNANVYNTIDVAQIGVAYLINASFDSTNSGTTAGSNTDTLIGYNFSMITGSPSVIGTSYGVKIDAPNNSGTINNHYGIYLGDQTIAGATNNYAIYSGGGKVYFAGDVTGNSFAGAGTGLTGTAASFTAGTATNATNVAVTDDTATNADYYPTFVSATSGTSGIKISSSKFTYHPSTGIATAVDFVSSSDARYKENILPVMDALAKVNAMRGVHYNRKDDPDKRVEMGMIAQELRQVCPELVWSNTDGMLSISYARVVAVLVEAMKEQTARIKALENLMGH
jgi:hypothetical protein